MRESRTVGWNSSTGEFQFIADDPGPLLLVTPAQLDAALHQRDGSWLLRGYTQPDHSEWCEFVVRSPVMQLARSMAPASYGTTGTGQVAVGEAPETPSSASEWQPAPPLPPSGQTSPVSFFQPRSDAVERTEVVDMNWEVSAPLTPELYDTDSRPDDDRTSFSGNDTWIVRYVMTDPRVHDESERELTVRADSDAGALRALHAEMKKLGDEPTYRVVAVVPASQPQLAA